MTRDYKRLGNCPWGKLQWASLTSRECNVHHWACEHCPYCWLQRMEVFHWSPWSPRSNWMHLPGEPESIVLSHSKPQTAHCSRNCAWAHSAAVLGGQAVSSRWAHLTISLGCLPLLRAEKKKQLTREMAALPCLLYQLLLLCCAVLRNPSMGLRLWQLSKLPPISENMPSQARFPKWQRESANSPDHLDSPTIVAAGRYFEYTCLHVTFKASH